MLQTQQADYSYEAGLLGPVTESSLKVGAADDEVTAADCTCTVRYFRASR